jgi:hypothetical protein
MVLPVAVYGKIGYPTVVIDDLSVLVDPILEIGDRDGLPVVV